MGTSAPPTGDAGWRRGLDALRPSHQHSAFSATLLLMSAVMLSRVIGYVREAYIAYAFGAGAETDAYVAAFTIPDWLNHLVAGGTAAITFVSIFTRYVSQGREAEAQKAFNIIITVMTTVLVVGVGITMVFTPQIERRIFPGFSPEQLELCVRLTRILLPAQIFFYVGGVVSAVLLSRRMFLFPALAPLLYNVFIILGGVTLSSQMGIASLAVGAVVGGFTGPFLINAIGAARTGVRYRPSFETSHLAFREWVWLSIPLMLGVSLVTADEWIMRFFASAGEGDLARLNYAKRLFAVPLAVLAQATGQASLPFFARLFGEGKKEEFAATVNGAVYRVSAVSMLAAAWMAAAALPAVDLVYRRGAFTLLDSVATAEFFFWFALSLPFWSAQALYARAFYAAGNTVTPMVAGTLVTLASLPVYYSLFQTMSFVGLAIASGIGIVAHTVMLAGLLQRSRLVSLGALPWKELGKAALAAALAAAAGFAVRDVIALEGSRGREIGALALITLTWAAGGAAGLWLTRSELPALLRRRRPVEPPVAAAADESVGTEP
jgi:putative peptidoglycan lipid II flippase